MRRPGIVAFVLAAAVLLGGCGGGDGGGATSKEEWEEENGALVAAYSRDLADALNTINQGERTATISSCTQVSDDAKEVRSEALPVPNAAVNTALQKAVTEGINAAENCLKGARETNADAIEEAQVQFAAARKAMDEAEAAIEAWV